MKTFTKPITILSQFVLVTAAPMLFSLAVTAQSSVAWSTNYYSVTGANFREIRQSIAQSRPWKDPFDGDTRWSVDWKFTLNESGGSCSCSSFSTTTKIVTTLPRWTPPADVLPPVKEQWTRYFTNLTQHEAGHARIAFAAAAEIRKRLSETSAQPDCEQLRKTINQRAEKVVDDYRAREREYDRRTEHGTKPPDVP